MDIGGTGLQATAREDGTGYTVGEGMSLDADGMGEVTEGGGTFRVMRSEDGALAGTRFDMDIEGDPLTVDAKVTGADNPLPKLSTDDRDTDFNEKGTMLEALGAKFSMGALLGGGSDTATGYNIVDRARGEMVKIRDRVAGLVALRRDEGITDTAFTSQIRVQWGKADNQIYDVFGSGARDDQRLERTESASRVVDAFDRLVDALSTLENFAAATLENGPDKLQGFDARTAGNVGATFNRNKWTAAARLGSLGSTRFGAAMYNETPNAKKGYEGAEKVQAFAWSTMQAVRRAADVSAAGSATYAGSTLAADNEGQLYSGTINVSVSFTRMNVNGYITGLATADTQEPWTHGLGGEVTGIHLPDAELTRRGAWNVTGREDGNNTGRLQYAAQAGGEPDYEFKDGEATYAGQLLGRGDDSGREAIGTWKLDLGSTVLAGGFGATRGADRAPPGSGVTGELAAIGERSGTRAMLEAGPDALVAVDESGTDDDRPAIAASTVIDSAKTSVNFKYVPRPMNTPGELLEKDATEFVVGNYTPPRADVLEAEDWEGTKGNWVKDARAEIVKKLGQLRRVIALDGADASASDRAFANTQRQRLFDEIQAELAKVLGPNAAAGYVEDDSDTDANEAEMELYTGVLTREPAAYTGTGWTAGTHSDYPVNTGGVAEDATVLAEIEDVLEALGDADAFAEAFAAGGLFASARDLRLDPYPSPSAMFGRARGKLQIKTEYTDYTRLGAWSHQVSPDAAHKLALQAYADRGGRQELGAFAYSPLDPTAAYANASSRLYPAGATSDVTATYAGKTAAAQGDLFYRGDVEAKVFWKADDIEMSDVVVTVSNLEDTESGDPLQFGRAPSADYEGETPGIIDVESLQWTAKVDNDGVVQFASTSPVVVGANSVSGDPAYRPAYGPHRTLTADERTTYGPGITNNLRHFDGGSTSVLRIGTQPAGASYWIVNMGDGTSTEPFGALTFAGIGGTGATTTDSDPTYVAAKAQFDAGVEALIYPKWVVGGLWVADESNTPPPNSGDKPTRILVFADGSTAMMDQWFNHNAYLIGTEQNPLTGYQLRRYDNRPGLETRPDLVWNEYGQAWSKGLPTADGDGSTDVGAGGDLGDGHPAMTPGQLALAFLKDGEYVNVAKSDLGARASEIKGMFVGQDQQGPLGIIGTWELTGGAFGLGTERGDIRGAFGADIQP